MIEKMKKSQAIKLLIDKQNVLVYGGYKNTTNIVDILQHFDKITIDKSNIDFWEWRKTKRIASIFLEFSDNARVYTDNITLCYKKNDMLLLLKVEEDKTNILLYVLQ